MDELEAIFKWMHVFAGIAWIGHLYFFNWVNGPLQAKLDGPTKKALVPELMPRALYWFRWGAAYTWFTGLLLLAWSTTWEIRRWRRELGGQPARSLWSRSPSLPRSFTTRSGKAVLPRISAP